jgi:hypothetical protein
MNYKQKAIELVDNYRVMFYGKNSIPSKNKAKQCALKAVDEVLKAVSVNQVLYLTDMTYQIHYDYTKIKQEIEKL